MFGSTGVPEKTRAAGTGARKSAGEKERIELEAPMW